MLGGHHQTVVSCIHCRNRVIRRNVWRRIGRRWSCRCVHRGEGRHVGTWKYFLSVGRSRGCPVGRKWMPPSILLHHGQVWTGFARRDHSRDRRKSHSLETESGRWLGEKIAHYYGHVGQKVLNCKCEERLSNRPITGAVEKNGWRSPGGRYHEIW